MFGPANAAKNLALHRPANQSSLSIWSKASNREAATAIDWPRRTKDVLAFCDRLLAELPAQGSALAAAEQSALRKRLAALQAVPSSRYGQAQYLEARWLQRRLALANPLLDFEAILVTKRVPGSFNHMSDQYYGWWSRPGGGIYLLKRLQDRGTRARMPHRRLPRTRQLPAPGPLLRRQEGAVCLVQTLSAPGRRDQQARQGERSRGRLLPPVRDEHRRHGRPPVDARQV